METRGLFNPFVEIMVLAASGMVVAWAAGLLLGRLRASVRHLYWLMVIVGLLLFPATSRLMPKVGLAVLPVRTVGIETNPTERLDVARSSPTSTLGVEATDGASMRVPGSRSTGR